MIIVTYSVNAHSFCNEEKTKESCAAVKDIQYEMKKKANTGDWRTVIYSSKVINFIVALITYYVYSKQYKNLKILLIPFLLISITSIILTSIIYISPTLSNIKTVYKIEGSNKKMKMTTFQTLNGVDYLI